METHKKLTDTVIRKMTTSRLADTEVKGFVVKVGTTGEKRFYLEYRSPIDQKSKRMTLGKFGDMPTAEARKLAVAARGNIAKGIDPQEQRKTQRATIERQKMETLEAFLTTGYREVTPQKRADKDTKTIRNHFKSYLGKPMSSITSLMLEKWLNAYDGEPDGANRIFTALQGVLTKAVKAGLLASNPCKGVKKLQIDKSKGRNAISLEEEHRLMAAIDARQERVRAKRLRYIEHCKTRTRESKNPHGEYIDYLKPMFIVLLNTGLRMGELFNMKVSDLNNGWLTVRGTGGKKGGTGTKSGQTRYIPLNDKARTALETWISQEGNTDFVFPSPRTGKRLTDISTVWESVRDEAGLKVKLHELRHTFGTRLASQGKSIVTIQKLMGHGAVSTTSQYLHTNDEQLIDAVEGL